MHNVHGNVIASVVLVLVLRLMGIGMESRVVCV